MKKIAIFGSSGHGRDIADICIDCDYEEILFLTTDQGFNKIGKYDVFIDTEQKVFELKNNGYHFAIGIGSPDIKMKIIKKYPDLEYPNLIHSSVTFGNLQISRLDQTNGNIFAAGCRLTNNILMGNHAFFGVNSVIGHDCILKDFITIMPTAVVSANVLIEEAVYIGAAASIIQGGNDIKLKIGEGATIGMGAVVLKDILPHNTVVGVPAKPI